MATAAPVPADLALAWATLGLAVVLSLLVAAIAVALVLAPVLSPSWCRLRTAASRRASAPASTAAPPGAAATERGQDLDAWRRELHAMALDDVLRRHNRARD
jgi:hypothetical protein